MHVADNVIRDRALRFLEERIPRSRSRATFAVEVYAAQPLDTAVDFEQAVTSEFTRVHVGHRWGAPWTTTWFRIDGIVPDGVPTETLELEVDLGFDVPRVGFQAEGLVYREDGTIIKGLNARSQWIPIGRARFSVYVEASAVPMVLDRGPRGYIFAPTELGDPLTAGSEPQYTLGKTRLIDPDQEVVELSHDLRVLLELVDELPRESNRRWTVLRSIDSALDQLDPHRISQTSARARAELMDVLAAPAEHSAHILSAVGHAHIDSAWLWPFRETRRKVSRTVANVLNLMDSDPDLVYAMSSAQHFEWLRVDQPQLFARVRERVAEGRFVPVGGMWVESDTNMPSGEALVRQFLEGARLFHEEFGITQTDIVWLPDSFGYTAALPQIIRGTGAHRFLTQKISWNTTNRFPHHTFWWEGIDGSRVFSHFPSADTYNGQLTGAELEHAARNFADKGRSHRSLLPFGFGDGGGGPVREMMASARRRADLEGSPRVRVERPEDFFAAVESEYAAPATWHGELYLEFHRGVFTTQVAMKQGNRRTEALFRSAELWCTQATVRTGVEYPTSTLRELWRRFLLLQFHDVLPGSSIAWVHREAALEFQVLQRELEALRDRALSVFADAGPSPAALANSSPFARMGVSAHAIGIAEVMDSPVNADAQANGSVVLDNGRVRVVVESDGTVSSLIDRMSGREAIEIGERANRPRLHNDAPNRWDAWDLDEFYLNTSFETDSATALEWGSEGGEAWAQAIHRTRDSTISLRTVLRSGAPEVEFETEVDWNDREKILKIEFPLAVATDTWRGEIQFGHVSRPTVRNTSWDTARFEACAHRWTHVGEPDYGVAIANDGVYGHEARRIGRPDGGAWTLCRLSLLRAPGFPDPDADRGTHRFVYRVIPNASVADAVRAGYELGDSTVEIASAPVAALLTSSHPAILVDTIKIAEDGSGDVIARMYESLGTTVAAVLTPGMACSDAQWADLLERPQEEPADLAVARFRPFEVRTLRLTPARQGRADLDYLVEPRGRPGES